MLRKLYILLLCAAASLAISAQDYIESYSHNSDFRGSERTLQYSPDREGYITCHNGKNLYTRALYGGNSLWRLETSDMPIFAAYHKTDNRNIHFAVTVKGRTLRLDSVADCTALYRGGERIYRLSDPSWGKGTLTLTAVACYDQERAIWQVTAKEMPKGAVLTAVSCEPVKVKLNRSGDMGADPANCFAPDPQGAGRVECSVPLTGNIFSVVESKINGKAIVGYISYCDRNITADDQPALAEKFADTQRLRQQLISRIVIDTPDDYINTLGPTLVTAGDGIWDGKTYQHGAVGWRMPLSGWRGAYTGDFLGWHDRARTHFDAYAASQVTDVEPTIAHPSQDPAMNMARAEKRWGTQMYSNGYICRNPERNDQMHHYDMNLCYIDELLWHLKWTGDLDYARKIWPTVKLSLEWEKRNYDPNDDGLYDAYCCIWASDALYYNSGAVTHSTAYSYRANKVAAEIAEAIGEDPTPYRAEADKILKAMNKILWLDDRGVWAEYRDLMGNRLVHDHPAVWTVYHAIDGETASREQAYSATGYIDRNIPHIPVTAVGLKDEGYATISTTDWMPYAWSINNVAFAEVYNTALSFWQAGRRSEAFALLKSAMLDGMFIGNSPGNIGQISHYDAARGESYRDFADPVGVLSRAVVQGLFGFSPDAINHSVTVSPGWPLAWEKASITHPDFTLNFNRDRATDIYRIILANNDIDSIHLRLPALRERITSVTANGIPAQWSLDPESYGHPYICISLPAHGPQTLEVAWDGQLIVVPKSVPSSDGKRYREISQGDMKWLVETDNAKAKNPTYTDDEMGIFMLLSPDATYEPVDMAQAYNANITDIFRNKYLSPRSPMTTLQIPVHGIGEWCHPSDSAHIDDSGLRNAGGSITLPQGMVFSTPPTGHNVLYTSMFDNYPTHASVPLSGNARAINLLMVGSTNHMQCHVENARVEIEYTDGTTKTLSLRPPYNWCPVEQDYYIDGKAFTTPNARPYRITLKDAKVSQDLASDLNIDGVYGRRIDGGAGVLLGIPLDETKQLKQLNLQTLANDVVVGLAAATLVR